MSKNTLPPENQLKKINEFNKGNLVVELFYPQYYKNFGKFNWLSFYKKKEKEDISLFEYFNFNLLTDKLIIPIETYSIDNIVVTTIFDSIYKERVEVISMCGIDDNQLTLVFGNEDEETPINFYDVASEIKRQYEKLERESIQLKIIETEGWEEKLQKLLPKDEKIVNNLKKYKTWDYGRYNWNTIFSLFTK